MDVKHGAKIILLDKDDFALVLRRSETHPHIPFTADLPGGEMDKGETAEQAVCRELDEEAKIVLKEEDIQLIGKRSFGAFGREYDLYLFLANVETRPSVVISWEHDQFEWKPVTEIKDLDDGFQPMLDEYLSTR